MVGLKITKYVHEKGTLLVALAMLIQFNVVGQSQLGRREVKSSEKCVDKIVDLLTFNSDSSTVILYENDSIRVLTYVSIFENDMANLLETKSRTNFKENFKGFFDQVLEEAHKNNSCNAYQLAFGDSLITWAFMNRVAGLLEQGQCVIFCKKEKQFVAKIKVLTYVKSYRAGGMGFGSKGRRFFQNDIQFWDQLDESF